MPSEPGCHRPAESARLNVADRAPVIRGTRVDVVRDAAGIADVLAVQLERPARVLEPGAQANRVVARQVGARVRLQRARCTGKCREIVEARADIAPGCPSESAVGAERTP